MIKNVVFWPADVLKALKAYKKDASTAGNLGSYVGVGLPLLGAGIGYMAGTGLLRDRLILIYLGGGVANAAVKPVEANLVMRYITGKWPFKKKTHADTKRGPVSKSGVGDSMFGAGPLGHYSLRPINGYNPSPVFPRYPFGSAGMYSRHAAAEYPAVPGHSFSSHI